MGHILVWTVPLHITHPVTGGAVQLLQLTEPPADLDLFSLNSFKLQVVLGLSFSRALPQHRILCRIQFSPSS